MNSKLLRAGVLLLLMMTLAACARVDSRASALHLGGQLGEQMLELGCSRARQIIGQEEFAILHGTLSRSL